MVSIPSSIPLRCRETLRHGIVSTAQVWRPDTNFLNCVTLCWTGTISYNVLSKAFISSQIPLPCTQKPILNARCKDCRKIYDPCRLSSAGAKFWLSNQATFLYYVLLYSTGKEVLNKLLLPKLFSIAAKYRI